METIYEILKADHKVVKTLLKRLDDTSETNYKERLTLLKSLKEALVPHARAEEQVFYESLKESKVKEAQDLAFEGYEEHAVADHLFDEIESTATKDKRWGALMSVLKEAIEHHIEQEEGNMFKKAQKSFDKDMAEIMGAEFIALKEDFLTELRAGGKLVQPPSHSI